ncbi:MAG: hypothetical protein C0402_10125 [Thermodesulfovibrio sp.]|nr:hypothetical protein [Thermodesulfovibrio sp.]
MGKRISGIIVFLLIAINAFAANGDFYVDGNLGVGTTNPGAKLEVSGNIKLSGSAPTYTVTNIANPINSSDAATKAYVDNAGVVSTTGINGSAILNGTFSLTGNAGVYQDTGLAIQLPSSGTYHLSGKVRAAWNIPDYTSTMANPGPTMTGFSAPSPNLVTSSGEYGSVYYTWNLFNHSTGGYEGVISTPTGYVQLDLGSGNSLRAAGYMITGVTSAHAQLTSNAKNWNLSGSNDGTNWSVLDTQTNQTNWTSMEARSFLINTPGNYRYYRWNITANNGATYSGAFEFAFISDADMFGKITCRLFDATANVPCGGNTLVVHSTTYNKPTQATAPIDVIYAAPGANLIKLQCSRNMPFGIGWTISSLLSDGDGETAVRYIRLQ